MAQKSGNTVNLDGKFEFDGEEYIEYGKIRRPVVFFRIMTDDEKSGGHHHIVAYDQVAEKIIATSKSFSYLVESGRVVPDSVSGGLMDVSIRGWLRTMSKASVVVAESVTFHTYEIVREYAKHFHNNNVAKSEK
jgi:hypothetical protein